MLSNDPSLRHKVKVIRVSGEFGMPPVVVHPDMDPALKAALRDALLGMHEDAEGRAALEPIGFDRFRTVRDPEYDEIRVMIEVVRGAR